MGTHVILMPDVGEGIAEAEIAELLIPVGDVLREDDIFASVMTDKATVEIPSTVSGKVTWYAGEVGDSIAIGAPLVKIEVDGPGNEAEVLTVEPDPESTVDAEPTSAVDAPAKTPASAPAPPPLAPPKALQSTTKLRTPREKPVASPAVRRRALDAGVDLRQVPGSGQGRRVTHEDLDGFIALGGTSPLGAGRGPDTSVEEVKVVGLRRKIAERMVLAKTRIPHITIVEEVDVTSLEELRGCLNAERGDRPKLTILPFLMSAMVTALREQQNLNALYYDDDGIVHQHGAVHIGIATQTPAGLMVPVVRHCEARSIWDMASELGRVAEAARTGTAAREELSGSTISITSLGKLGAIATTPIINYPEVAIIGVNKMTIRPMWNGTEFVPRKVMNLSSSFDHRVIDGWDAAVFVQRLKTLLETPAMIFVEG
ncbi:MAG: dihydrolipoamide acetyltransferase family protein [Pseudomonadota bacterium]